MIIKLFHNQNKKFVTWDFWQYFFLFTFKGTHMTRQDWEICVGKDKTIRKENVLGKMDFSQ